MEDVRYPFVRHSSLLAQVRMHPRTTAGAVLGLFLILAGAVAVQRLIGHEAQEATGLRRWRARFEDWRDGMGDRWRDLDVGGRFRRLDLPGRAAPVRDRAVRYARDHAVEGVGTLTAVVAILGAVAVAMHERRDQP